jgi:hypothetical protein
MSQFGIRLGMNHATLIQIWMVVTTSLIRIGMNFRLGRYIYIYLYSVHFYRAKVMP